MTVTTTETSATPSWWRQTGPSGEADAKEDVRGPASGQSEDGDGFGFSDFLDVINPLQHIPIVSTLYREMTGDQIGATARTMGGALYGGPVGLIAALANNVAEAETGRDLGSHAVALATGGTVGAKPQAEGEAGTRIARTVDPTSLSRPDTAGRADPAQITLRFNGEDGRAGATTPPIPITGAPPAPGAMAQPAAPARASAAASSPASPPDAPAAPRTTEETIAAATAARTPRQEMPSLSSDAFDRLMRKAGAQRATSVDNAGNAALSPAKTGRLATVTPEGRESVHDWMVRALEKYEQMKGPVGATGSNAG